MDTSEKSKKRLAVKSVCEEKENDGVVGLMSGGCTRYDRCDFQFVQVVGGWISWAHWQCSLLYVQDSSFKQKIYHGSSPNIRGIIQVSTQLVNSRF